MAPDSMRAAARVLAVRSRAAQGLPFTVEDPDVLAKVAALLARALAASDPS